MLSGNRQGMWHAQERINAYEIFDVKPEGNKPIKRDQCVDGMVILWCVLKEIRYDDMEWMHVVQHTVQWRAVVNTVMNLRVQ
jgi:hypothetical protein